MEILSVNIPSHRPTLSAEIRSDRPVIAADLEELRYLVFQGMKGADGESAYDLAVALGFEGSEQAWLESLAGADGKNYGIVVDGSTDHVLELKSLEIETAAVTSVNGKSGAVTLGASDVGALPDSTEIPNVPEDAVRLEILAYTAGSAARMMMRLYDLQKYLRKNVKLWAHVTLTRQTQPTLDVQTFDADLVVSDLDFDQCRVKLLIAWDGAWHEVSLSAKNQMTAPMTGTFSTVILPSAMDAAPTAGSENPVTSGGVYTALQSLQSVGWEQIQTGTGGDLSFVAGNNLSEIDHVEAYCCAALGLVRLMIRGKAVSSPAVNMAGNVRFEILFGPSSRYRPKVTPMSSAPDWGTGLAVLSGAANSISFPCNVALWSNLQIFGDAGSDAIDGGEEVFITGFYYTEDIPAGGDS